VSTALYQARLRAIRLQAAGIVQARFDGLATYDKDGAEPFARSVAPVVAAAQLTAARTAAAYVARAARVPPARITPALVTGPAARKGVSLADEYQRPFVAVWHALAEGRGFDEAVRAGRSYAGVLAATDVWLATRAATAVVDEATPAIVGWSRVADPGACDECSLADGMTMAQAADMAGHPNCGCTSEPITGTAPPPEPVADGLAVEDHDELGPVLRPAG
jgi:hypothetical protein